MGAPGSDGAELLASARRMSIGSQLARAARTRPNAVAFQHGSERRTYAELDQRVTRLARALAERGIGRGDRVAVLMTNRLETLESYFATCRLGAMAVPVNFRLVPAEIAYILADSDAHALIVDEHLAAGAAAALKPLADDTVPRAPAPSLSAVLVTGGGETTAGLGAEPYEAVLVSADPAPLDIDVAEGEAAFIMYTSGTTGRPKGAVLTHLNLFMNIVNIMAVGGVSAQDEVSLSGMPLFHIGGLAGALSTLFVGGRMILLRSGEFDAAEFVDLLEREQVTGCALVPSQWKEICELPGIHDRNLALRHLAWAASPAPASLLRTLERTFPGVPATNAFGQTEMSPVTCVLRGEDAIRKAGSVGRPVANVEARIVDEKLREVPTGEVGEIVYRGPTVMREYWRAPDATAAAFEGGWFHSGDLCRMDAEGFVYVVDRKKDMIISGGENIYCAEVEAAIDRHPKVRETAVVGMPHEKWVETPRAFIVPRDPADPPTEREIIEHCRSLLASYKKPTSVVVVDALPRNAVGKIQKFQLRAYQGGSRA